MLSGSAQPLSCAVVDSQGAWVFNLDSLSTYGTVFFTLVISAVGVPIPEELAIVAGGVCVGNAWDKPDSGLYWWIMLPVCMIGVVACDAILYGIGRRWGTRLLELKWVQKRFLTPEKRAKIERNFHDYGISILLVARLLPGIRSPMFIMSGVLRVPFRKFILADAIYAIPGVNLLFWLSYWFTDQFQRAFNKVEGNRPIVAAVILAAVAGFLLYSYVFKRRIVTGDPKDVPIVGKQMAQYTHAHVKHEQEETVPLGKFHFPPKDSAGDRCCVSCPDRM